MKHLLPKLKNLGALPALITLLLLPGLGWGQTTVFSDDFSTDQSTTWTTSGQIGSSAFSVSRSGADWGARRNTSPAQLEITNDVGATANATGWAFAYAVTSSFSSPYNTTLSSNPGLVTWYFNIRQPRTDPAGFGSGSYGAAYILAGSSTTAYNAGTGYAIALGQSGNIDAIRLVKYSAGITSLTNIIASNTSGLTDFGTEYVSVKVTYTPSSNTWELFLRNDGTTAFADPMGGTLVSQGTAVDNSYTSTSLAYMGGYWQGSTAGSQTAFFDNITVQVTASGANTPPSITNIVQTPATGVLSSTTVSVSADVSDSDGTVEGVALYWGTSSGNLTNNIDMSLVSGDTYTTDSDIPAQAAGTTVYYAVYAIDDDADEATSEEQSYFVNYDEPSNHVTTFIAATGTPAFSVIDVVWDDATGTVVPTGYLIKGSDVSYAAISAPLDGTPETDALLVKNIASGTEVASFTGLNENTTYYFKIYPYTNTGINIDYKTNGTVPQDEATTEEAPPLPAIFFSEYIEGSLNNKAIEIYNGTGSDIDLSLLTVNLYSGGSPTVSNSYTGSGSLVNGQTFIIANASASQPILNIADVTSNVTFYNGDDALELVYNGQPIDVIGTIGEDPGTAWSVAGTTNATAEYTLIRKLNVTNGNTNWAVSAGTNATDSEWVVKPQDYIGNLGLIGTVWQGTSTDWTAEANWDMGVPSTYQAWVVPAAETPVISTTETVSDIIVLGNNLHIAPTGFLTATNLLGILEPGIVTIEPLGKLSGEIYNLGTEASLILQSDETGTGSVIPTVTGNPATIERYITAATWETAGSGWHLLSSPVAAQGISGDWTPTGTGNDYDFYAFDETASTDNWLNQKVGANNITTFIPGKGYLVAYQQTDTKTFSGNLNVADVTLSGLTNTGTSAYPGWHLAGNPFASAINWGSGTWTKTNINAVAQVWSSADGSYKTTTEKSDIIPAMNGFMVYTTGSGELTIPADAREHNAANWYKSDEEFILLKANDLEGLTSQSSIVRFNPSATEAYDADFDAYFLAGFAPMFYSVSGSSLYALNTLPAVSNELAIPFGFMKNSATNYNIELAKNIPATIVYLTDIKTGTVTNLTDEGAYHFTAAEGDDANRFTLHFGTLGMDDPSTTAPVNIYAYGGVVYLNGPDAKASVTITDLTGRVVMAERVNGNGLSMINAGSLPKGVYVVTAVAGSRVVSAKVIL
ncbi:protein containing Por secretion system C-terminal sorting domain [Lentimicrobium saccharophilum]|uniref:Protein containing Por secretion system C-terminal sorting domain n=1 Tax=Lentimicrobium saccharophilum TaxID=1678841 RepID=A0A0S7BQU7_9BACT|nr:T9SS type A sorting domain-containing protein [Lentimicrobium saccharophilum]GAP42621.1 protein containing Por secretion system C-terminal sorting domain [Lentimicrobium saccharophilum]